VASGEALKVVVLWMHKSHVCETHKLICGRACSVSAGIVSALERKGAELGLDSTATDYIQTDAATAAGSSGGPLVNVQVRDSRRPCQHDAVRIQFSTFKLQPRT
jgi:Trypsin-like peptidase domain